jgi:hypothetical protein
VKQNEEISELHGLLSKSFLKMEKKQQKTFSAAKKLENQNMTLSSKVH